MNKCCCCNFAVFYTAGCSISLSIKFNNPQMVCEWVQQLAVIKCDWMLRGCWSVTRDCKVKGMSGLVDGYVDYFTRQYYIEIVILWLVVTFCEVAFLKIIPRKVILELWRRWGYPNKCTRWIKSLMKCSDLWWYYYMNMKYFE